MPTREEEVAKWLDENIRRYPQCSIVKLTDFTWSKPPHYGGAFTATFAPGDGGETFSFAADGAGEIQISGPAFVSPLGVPATYPAIDISESARKAVLIGVRYLVPRLKPFGIDPVTGVHIDATTPLPLRLLQPLKVVRAKILAPSLAITVDVLSGDIRLVAS
jgi:hypothetical protein